MAQRAVPFLAVAALAILGLALAALPSPVGGVSAHVDDDPPCATPAAGGPFLGIADPAAPYDLRFLDEMIVHHQGAIVSAGMMIADSDRPELRDLARRIQEGQERQIEQMRAWREAWYPDAPPPRMDMDPMAEMMGGMMDGDEGMGDMMGDMMDMMDGGMMGGMMGGEQADRMFLRMMIPHHQLAIDMAEDALRHARHEELKELAHRIIADQTAEIEEMEGYLRAWYGEESTRAVAGEMRDMMSRMMGGMMGTPAAC